jgi:hypothetical protein
MMPDLQCNDQYLLPTNNDTRLAFVRTNIFYQQTMMADLQCKDTYILPTNNDNRLAIVRTNIFYQQTMMLDLPLIGQISFTNKQ